MFTASCGTANVLKAALTTRCSSESGAHSGFCGKVAREQQKTRDMLDGGFLTEPKWGKGAVDTRHAGRRVSPRAGMGKGGRRRETCWTEGFSPSRNGERGLWTRDMLDRGFLPEPKGEKGAVDPRHAGPRVSPRAEMGKRGLWTRDMLDRGFLPEPEWGKGAVDDTALDEYILARVPRLRLFVLPLLSDASSHGPRMISFPLSGNIHTFPG